MIELSRLSNMALVPILAAMVVFAGAGRVVAMDKDIGTEAGSCQFPTVVRLAGLCTGVYMGQGLILTAAHCISANKVHGGSAVLFGEDLQ